MTSQTTLPSNVMLKRPTCTEKRFATGAGRECAGNGAGRTQAAEDHERLLRLGWLALLSCDDALD